MRFSVVAIGAAVASVFLAVAPRANAACAPSTPPDAAVAQYVEQVPTSCGSHSTYGASHKTTLSKKVQKKVQKAGKQASALNTIATDSTYGAPQQSLPAQQPTQAVTPTVSQPVAPKPHVKHHRRHAKPKPAPTPAPTPVIKKPTVPTIHVNVAPTTSDVQSGRVIGLLVILFGATVAMLVASRRRRTPRTAAG